MARNASHGKGFNELLYFFTVYGKALCYQNQEQGLQARRALAHMPEFMEMKQVPTQG
jgi:hypothetical protein